jgi:hypothetical protein
VTVRSGTSGIGEVVGLTPVEEVTPLRDPDGAPDPLGCALGEVGAVAVGSAVGVVSVGSAVGIPEKLGSDASGGPGLVGPSSEPDVVEVQAAPSTATAATTSVARMREKAVPPVARQASLTGLSMAG